MVCLIILWVWIGLLVCIVVKVISVVGLFGMIWLSDCLVVMVWFSFVIVIGYG